jgi:hypothetical protein
MPQDTTQLPLPLANSGGTLRPVPAASLTKKTVTLRVRIDDELAARLQELSRREFLELSTYVRQTLAKHAAAATAPPPTKGGRR